MQSRPECVKMVAKEELMMDEKLTMFVTLADAAEIFAALIFSGKKETYDRFGEEIGRATRVWLSNSEGGTMEDEQRTI